MQILKANQGKSYTIEHLASAAKCYIVLYDAHPPLLLGGNITNGNIINPNTVTIREAVKYIVNEIYEEDTEGPVYDYLVVYTNDPENSVYKWEEELRTYRLPVRDIIITCKGDGLL